MIENMQNYLVPYVVELTYPIDSTEPSRIRAQSDRLLPTKSVNRHVVRLNLIGQPHSVWSWFLIWKCSKPLTLFQEISGPQPLDQEFSLWYYIQYLYLLLSYLIKVKEKLKYSIVISFQPHLLFYSCFAFFLLLLLPLSGFLPHFSFSFSLPSPYSSINNQ